MKKEYHFTISRTDRICLIIFVMLLLGWELVKHTWPGSKTDFDGFSATIQQHDVSPQEKNKYQVDARKKTTTYKSKPHYYTSAPEMQQEIYPVSIMEASVQDLRAIGFSSKVSYNIQKYIAAGGVIKNQNDLIRIYGMDSFQLKSTAPYVLYPAPPPDSQMTEASKDPKAWTKSNTIIDLNQATLAELDALPGIGNVLAERIIKFRTGLGGFLHVEQLQEIYGLPEETYEKIKPSLALVTPPQPIHINETDLTTFHHPYLPKKFVSMMKAYKTQHGPFKDASDLRKVFPPDSTWCDKVLPYIAFDRDGNEF